MPLVHEGSPLLIVATRLAIGQPVFTALEVGAKLTQFGLQRLHLDVVRLSSLIEQVGLLLCAASGLSSISLGSGPQLGRLGQAGLGRAAE